ncbi:MAG: tRNA (adenosine(37)-N6)-threonylcarbamoyltransferase complex ATPase subunit type 1 TsaE [Deltaproteobacteria bacterium]|nr:tRNA (adenosine(37)-N6)-threonylcarbamoyltransferase complex ATPase subunit type 1 TsaE [Deltaproteobacteria bacterium]
MHTSLEFILKDVEETIALGERLGTFVKSGQVVALIGELGAGKTTLAKAIARGLGVADDVIVSSPSYTLVNEYDGRFPLYHFDLYRLEGAHDIHDLGYDEYLEGEGVSLLEWADIAPELLPKEHLEIRMEIINDKERKMTLKARGKDSERILDRLHSKYKAGSL